MPGQKIILRSHRHERMVLRWFLRKQWPKKGPNTTFGRRKMPGQINDFSLTPPCRDGFARRDKRGRAPLRKTNTEPKWRAPRYSKKQKPKKKAKENTSRVHILFRCWTMSTSLQLITHTVKVIVTKKKHVRADEDDAGNEGREAAWKQRARVIKY